MHSRQSACARIALFFCSIFLVGTTVLAAPVTWTLQGATFVDGGTASGSFVYDADAPGGQILSTFSISVAGGDTVTFPPITYDPSNSFGSVADGGAGDFGAIFGLSGPGETRGIRIPAVSVLTDAGGTLAINTAGLGAGECYNCGPQRSFAGGNLVGAAPPQITSAAAATFVIGANVAFTVTTSGAPPPALSVAGALPPGVAFVDNGDGTATFSGTANAIGTFALTITATNGTAPDATQAFTFTVRAPQRSVAAPTLGQYGLAACVLLLLLAGVRGIPSPASRRR